MPKTITLRLSDRTYGIFRSCAEADNRTIANFIETAAMRHLAEESLTDPSETREILSDRVLLADLHAGHRDARKRRGRFVA
jgi:hypothetical protein